jgi:hypothetical protein
LCRPNIVSHLLCLHQCCCCLIFYVLWTFADFDRLCKLEKRGDEIKKKSSPLKLLSQSQPNFAEMILGWFPSKIVSGDLGRTQFWEGPTQGPSCPIWFHLVQRFQRRRFKCDLLSK